MPKKKEDSLSALYENIHLDISQIRKLQLEILEFQDQLKKLEYEKAIIQGNIKLSIYNETNDKENNVSSNETMLQILVQQQLSSHEVYLNLLEQIEELELKEKQFKIEVEFLYNRVKLNQIYLRVGNFPLSKEKIREFTY
ncbi:hypothetical protein [Candidatus Hodarchaeum mangrovi]